MKLEIDVSKSELLAKLKAVSKVINPSNKVIPAHANFLFEIKEEFNVTGADGSGNITATVDCMFGEPEEKLSFLVDVKTIMDGLKELPEQPITLVFEQKDKVYSTTILHQTGKYKIQTFGSDGFSVAKNASAVIKIVKIKSSDFLHGIKSVYQFANNDELRPVMNSVYFQSKAGNLSFCSTNGGMMAILDFCPAGAIDSLDNIFYSDFDIILPIKLAKIILDLVLKETEIELEIGDKNVTITFENIKIVYRLVEGNYPNYRSVLPKNNNKILTSNTSEVISALRRILVFADTPKSPVQINASKSNLNLINKYVDESQFSDENVSATFNESGYSMVFSTESLMKCLEAITTEEVRMTFSDPTKACIITPDDVNIGLLVLIMPTSINV